jgi:hypothetical protein
MQNLTAVNVATIVWIGATILLGGLGYVIGGRVSRHLWGEKSSES